MGGLAFRFRSDTQRTREHYRCPGARACRHAASGCGGTCRLAQAANQVTPARRARPAETRGIAQLAAGDCSHLAPSSR